MSINGSTLPQPRQNPNSIGSLPPHLAQQWWTSLTKEQKARESFNWPRWARPDQLEPPQHWIDQAGKRRGPWLTWFLCAGRGFGKTRTLSEWVIQQSRKHGRITIVGETAADCRDIIVGGESGIMARSPPWWRPTYVPSSRSLEWPNGSKALLISAVEPDQLRGVQSEVAAVDELAKYRYASDVWAQLMFGLRLGEWPRVVVASTPRSISIVRKLLAAESTYVTRGSTYANLANLAPMFRETLADYEGTRLGQQEINGEVVDDVPGALWTYEQLAECFYTGPVPEFERVIIGVDPSGGNKDSSDKQGIVVVGKGLDGFIYVIEDCTMKGTPPQWGSRVARAYNEHGAGLVIIEATYGQALATNVLDNAMDKTGVLMRVQAAQTGRKNKPQRADGLAALYARKMVRHLGKFEDLVNQMVLMASDGYHGDGSPDALDALVWACDPFIPRPRTIAFETV